MCKTRKSNQTTYAHIRTRQTGRKSPCMYAVRCTCHGTCVAQRRTPVAQRRKTRTSVHGTIVRVYCRPWRAGLAEPAEPPRPAAWACRAPCPPSPLPALHGLGLGATAYGVLRRDQSVTTTRHVLNGTCPGRVFRLHASATSKRRRGVVQRTSRGWTPDGIQAPPLLSARKTAAHVTLRLVSLALPLEHTGASDGQRLLDADAASAETAELRVVQLISRPPAPQVR